MAKSIVQIYFNKEMLKRLQFLERSLLRVFTGKTHSEVGVAAAEYQAVAGRMAPQFFFTACLFLKELRDSLRELNGIFLPPDVHNATLPVLAASSSAVAASAASSRQDTELSSASKPLDERLLTPDNIEQEPHCVLRGVTLFPSLGGVFVFSSPWSEVEKKRALKSMSGSTAKVDLFGNNIADALSQKAGTWIGGNLTRANFQGLLELSETKLNAYSKGMENDKRLVELFGCYFLAECKHSLEEGEILENGTSPFSPEQHLFRVTSSTRFSHINAYRLCVADEKKIWQDIRREAPRELLPEQPSEDDFLSVRMKFVLERLRAIANFFGGTRDNSTLFSILKNVFFRLVFFAYGRNSTHGSLHHLFLPMHQGEGDAPQKLYAYVSMLLNVSEMLTVIDNYRLSYSRKSPTPATTVDALAALAKNSMRGVGRDVYYDVVACNASLDCSHRNELLGAFAQLPVLDTADVGIDRPVKQNPFSALARYVLKAELADQHPDKSVQAASSANVLSKLETVCRIQENVNAAISENLDLRILQAHNETLREVKEQLALLGEIGKSCGNYRVHTQMREFQSILSRLTGGTSFKTYCQELINKLHTGQVNYSQTAEEFLVFLKTLGSQKKRMISQEGTVLKDYVQQMGQAGQSVKEIVPQLQSQLQAYAKKTEDYIRSISEEASKLNPLIKAQNVHIGLEPTGGLKGKITEIRGFQDSAVNEKLEQINGELEVHFERAQHAQQSVIQAGCPGLSQQSISTLQTIRREYQEREKALNDCEERLTTLRNLLEAKKLFADQVVRLERGSQKLVNLKDALERVTTNPVEQRELQELARQIGGLCAQIESDKTAVQDIDTKAEALDPYRKRIPQYQERIEEIKKALERISNAQEAQKQKRRSDLGDRLRKLQAKITATLLPEAQALEMTQQTADLTEFQGKNARFLERLDKTTPPLVVDPELSQIETATLEEESALTRIIAQLESIKKEIKQGVEDSLTRANSLEQTIDQAIKSPSWKMDQDFLPKYKAAMEALKAAFTREAPPLVTVLTADIGQTDWVTTKLPSINRNKSELDRLLNLLGQDFVSQQQRLKGDEEDFCRQKQEEESKRKFEEEKLRNAELAKSKKKVRENIEGEVSAAELTMKELDKLLGPNSYYQKYRQFFAWLDDFLTRFGDEKHKKDEKYLVGALNSRKGESQQELYAYLSELMKSVKTEEKKGKIGLKKPIHVHTVRSALQRREPASAVAAASSSNFVEPDEGSRLRTIDAELARISSERQSIAERIEALKQKRVKAQAVSGVTPTTVFVPPRPGHAGGMVSGVASQVSKTGGLSQEEGAELFRLERKVRHLDQQAADREQVKGFLEAQGSKKRIMPRAASPAQVDVDFIASPAQDVSLDFQMIEKCVLLELPVAVGCSVREQFDERFSSLGVDVEIEKYGHLIRDLRFKLQEIQSADSEAIIAEILVQKEAAVQNLASCRQAIEEQAKRLNTLHQTVGKSSDGPVEKYLTWALAQLCEHRIEEKLPKGLRSIEEIIRGFEFKKFDDLVLTDLVKRMRELYKHSAEALNEHPLYQSFILYIIKAFRENLAEIPQLQGNDSFDDVQGDEVRQRSEWLFKLTACFCEKLVPDKFKIIWGWCLFGLAERMRTEAARVRYEEECSVAEEFALNTYPSEKVVFYLSCAMLLFQSIADFDIGINFQSNITCLTDPAAAAENDCNILAHRFQYCISLGLNVQWLGHTVESIPLKEPWLGEQIDQLEKQCSTWPVGQAVSIVPSQGSAVAASSSLKTLFFAGSDLARSSQEIFVGSSNAFVGPHRADFYFGPIKVLCLHTPQPSLIKMYDALERKDLEGRGGKILRVLNTLLFARSETDATSADLNLPEVVEERNRHQKKS